MADDIDLSSYVANNSVPDSDLPELKPSLTTFYFPATPEETKAAGLSYKMEGGIRGGGRFGDIDLRNHTLEKYDAGESKFVAVAMPGVPTGDFYKMPFPDGAIRTVRNIDTGGGLKPGQVDIATANPDFARGVSVRSGGGGVESASGEATGAGMRQPVAVSEEEIDAILGKKKEEPKSQRGGGRKAATFTPSPIPEFNVPTLQQPFEIPQVDQGGGGFAGIPQTQIPPIAQPQELPMPTPEFGMPVQQAIEGSPRFAATGDIDLAAYVKANQSPTPTPSPTPTATAAPDVDLAAYVQANVSPHELPTPQIGQTAPSGIGQFVQGLGQTGVDLAKGFIPNTENIRSAATVMGAPVDPGELLRLGIKGALSDAAMVKEARKAGLLSKAGGRAVGHGLARAGMLIAPLKAGAAIRVADEAAALDRPPVQVLPRGENAVQLNVSPPVVHPEAEAVRQAVTSEIANRFLPERQLANELGMVTPDGPIIPSQLIAEASKLPPEAIAQHISNLMHNAGGSFLEQSAAVVVEEARLSERSTSLSKLARNNPTPANKLAAENAFKDVTDFHNNPVAKMKGIWSAGGKVMQSNNPIDLASLNGQREAWLRDVGKAPPSTADPLLQKLADNMYRANQDMVKLQNLWRADANALSPRVTPEMVREQILAKLKNMTPC